MNLCDIKIRYLSTRKQHSWHLYHTHYTPDPGLVPLTLVCPKHWFFCRSSQGTKALGSVWTLWTLLCETWSRWQPKMRVGQAGLANCTTNPMGLGVQTVRVPSPTSHRGPFAHIHLLKLTNFGGLLGMCVSQVFAPVAKVSLCAPTGIFYLVRSWLFEERGPVVCGLGTEAYCPHPLRQRSWSSPASRPGTGLSGSGPAVPAPPPWRPQPRPWTSQFPKTSSTCHMDHPQMSTDGRAQLEALWVLRWLSFCSKLCSSNRTLQRGSQDSANTWNLSTGSARGSATRGRKRGLQGLGRKKGLVPGLFASSSGILSVMLRSAGGSSPFP